MSETVKSSLQRVIDQIDGSWSVAHYIAVVGLQRIGSEGQIETCAFITHPEDQASYINEGLIHRGLYLLEADCDEEEDE